MFAAVAAPAAAAVVQSIVSVVVMGIVEWYLLPLDPNGPYIHGQSSI